MYTVPPWELKLQARKLFKKLSKNGLFRGVIQFFKLLLSVRVHDSYIVHGLPLKQLYGVYLYHAAGGIGTMLPSKRGTPLLGLVVFFCRPGACSSAAEPMCSQPEGRGRERLTVTSLRTSVQGAGIGQWVDLKRPYPGESWMYKLRTLQQTCRQCLDVSYCNIYK